MNRNKQFNVVDGMVYKGIWKGLLIRWFWRRRNKEIRRAWI